MMPTVQLAFFPCVSSRANPLRVLSSLNATGGAHRPQCYEYRPALETSPTSSSHFRPGRTATDGFLRNRPVMKIEW